MDRWRGGGNEGPEYLVPKEHLVEGPSTVVQIRVSESWNQGRMHVKRWRDVQDAQKRIRESVKTEKT